MLKSRDYLPLPMASTTTEKLFIISAPSGAGKTTLVRALLEQFPNFEFSISATTRPPRGSEIHGQHYYFLSAQEFLDRKEKGDFLEWEEVYPGRYYGTLYSEIDRIFAKGNYPIFDVDVEGGLNIRKQFGEKAISIFIKPPSLEILQERLLKRGTDNPEEIAQRFEKAAHEIRYAERFDHVLVNDDLTTAIQELQDLVAEHLSQ